ncbi:hypothetical protein AYL99_10678 [Fonsecaea erecta]|uniref:Uncharacterized protein n=1 Tax=Fonsecaea erecta TaxID=1367422 RepID=A0A178Z5C6_9EURO|nr:hypothetical protein AYL99_10678 [Fonsecaea erecta]OAP54978.1 hypothetical protein AYL99_10678 [Fonsecaea erecta]
MALWSQHTRIVDIGRTMERTCITEGSTFREGRKGTRGPDPGEPALNAAMIREDGRAYQARHRSFDGPQSGEERLSRGTIGLQVITAGCGRSRYCLSLAPWRLRARFVKHEDTLWSMGDGQFEQKQILFLVQSLW